jgi:hypothetical protein
MVQILLAETREAHAEHWRETADLVENNEQPVSLKDESLIISGTNMDPETILSKSLSRYISLLRYLILLSSVLS